MNPTPNGVRIDELASDWSVGYVQDDLSFVARRAAPVVPVKSQGGKFARYDKGDFNRRQMAKKAPGAPTPSGGYRTDNSGNYFCDVYALKRVVPVEETGNEQQPYDARRDTTVFLTQQALINWESLFADAVMKSGVWTAQADKVGGADFDKFSDSASTPLQLLREGIESIRTGAARSKRKVMAVIGAQVWSVLADHADLVDRIKHTSSDSVTPDLLARLLGIKDVLVAEGVVTSSKEGQSAALADIVGNSITLLYVNETPGIMNPSAAQTFMWSTLRGADQGGGQIESFDDPDADGEALRIKHAPSVQIVMPDAGCHFASCI